MKKQVTNLYRMSKAAWLFVVPGAVLLALFVLWPVLRALLWSFTDAGLLKPQNAEWIGIQNYSSLISSERFRMAFRNTAVFVLMVVPIQTLLAFFLALWVNRPEPQWRWLRHAFFVPVVVSMPVLAVIWSILYQPSTGDQMGLINQLISYAGGAPQSWLHDPHWALPAIAFMSIWQGVGLQMMVFLAALQGVSKDQLEAASIDGANAWQRLLHVIVPGVRHSIAFVVTVTTVLAFRLFVQPYLMTRGGPNGSTRSVIQYIYETTFLQRNLGLACAGALLFLAVVASVMVGQRLLSREEST